MKLIIDRVIKSPFERLQKVVVLALCVVLAGSIYSCESESVCGDCKDELYFYVSENGEKVFLYDYLLNDWLLVAFDPQTQTCDIVEFINQTGFFKPVDVSEIFYQSLSYCPSANEVNCMLFVNTKKPKSCTQMKNVIRQLENSPIVSFTSLVFEGNRFTDVPFYTKGLVMSFSTFFEVCVKDINGFSDVYEAAQETNTKIVCQKSDGFSKFENWFFLRVDESSKGNALQIANYFYETGKFRYANPDMILKEVNINK